LSRQITLSQPECTRDRTAPRSQHGIVWLASTYEKPKAVATMSTSPQKSVLIIEDDPDIRHLLGIRLKHAGYVPIEAANGTDGLRLVHERRPALVILDIGLPGMDGWQVLQRIRDITTTPVMILSARGLEAEKVRGLPSPSGTRNSSPESASYFAEPPTKANRKPNTLIPGCRSTSVRGQCTPTASTYNSPLASSGCSSHSFNTLVRFFRPSSCLNLHGTIRRQRIPLE
jgi:CheY-like chemotaxis protein